MVYIVMNGKTQALSIEAGTSLPPGYHAQPAWGFRQGRVFHEFNRAYGPPAQLDKRGPICQLDEDLSYWSVRWAGNSDAPCPPQWLRYGDARKPPNSRLTFERFSSVSHRRQQTSR